MHFASNEHAMQLDCGRGSALDPAGNLQCSPIPLAGLKGAAKGREGRGKEGKGREREKRDKDWSHE